MNLLNEVNLNNRHKIYHILDQMVELFDITEEQGIDMFIDTCITKDLAEDLKEGCK